MTVRHSSFLFIFGFLKFIQSASRVLRVNVFDSCARIRMSLQNHHHSSKSIASVPYAYLNNYLCRGLRKVGLLSYAERDFVLKKVRDQLSDHSAMTDSLGPEQNRGSIMLVNTNIIPLCYPPRRHLHQWHELLCIDILHLFDGIALSKKNDA